MFQLLLLTIKRIKYYELRLELAGLLPLEDGEEAAQVLEVDRVVGARGLVSVSNTTDL